ncbi:uncharacterized protein LOC111615672, partial [Centruroides sculpturatus]|uniref:uncharacterized protein LOC111615672 n=1 Tax=Centruroides sculpturatus TaxID=218467 RepID=UPI000C6D3483
MRTCTEEEFLENFRIKFRMGKKGKYYNNWVIESNGPSVELLTFAQYSNVFAAADLDTLPLHVAKRYIRQQLGIDRSNRIESLTQQLIEAKQKLEALREEINDLRAKKINMTHFQDLTVNYGSIDDLKMNVSILRRWSHRSFKMATPVGNMIRVMFRQNFRPIALEMKNFHYCNIIRKEVSSVLVSNSEMSDAQTVKIQKISKAMKAYLERAKRHEEFIEKETREYEIGKRHLANMMGVDPDMFTQEDIDKAIEYLMPSGLFEKESRPIMKHPSQIFPKQK